jgi:uncharacterized protein YbjT (DUF2867 family)
MKRTAAIVFAYAGLGALMAAWCVLACRAGRPGRSPDWDAAPPSEMDRLANGVLCGAYHRPIWDATPPGERERYFAGRLARYAAKERLTYEVIAGRLSLLEAASAFREWDGREPRMTPETGPLGVSGDGPEERYCRSVIEWVNHKAPSELADDLARRLEKELEGRLREGPLQLPAPTEE